VCGFGISAHHIRKKHRPTKSTLSDVREESEKEQKNRPKNTVFIFRTSNSVRGHFRTVFRLFPAYAKRSENNRVKELLKKCSGMKIISEKYIPSCFMARNRYLVEHSQRVIAVYDGREKRGTVFTMRNAHFMERDVRVIEY